MTGEVERPCWRAMTDADVDGVVAVARLAFPNHFEDRACFAERLSLYPRGCFVLDDDGRVAGYLIAYPWREGSAPPLNTLIGAIPPAAELIYLHDLALHPNLRGRGLAKEAVDRLVAQERVVGWPKIALVAVNSASAFWERLGFEASADADLAAKFASYGNGAIYMTRRI